MLLLHYFQGLKYSTVGEILNLGEAAVKVAVHRGRRALRRLLTAEFPERARRTSHG
jgi:DNA-directed RNA polymerase specialized sigma24 family protein